MLHFQFFRLALRNPYGGNDNHAPSLIFTAARCAGRRLLLKRKT
jgi:hypothetical protein